MSAPLGPMVAAEWRKILSRGSARLGLALSVAVPVVAVVLLHGIETWQVGNLSGPDVPNTLRIHVDGAAALGWSLKGRNFFVLPLVLLWLSAQSLGGEISDGTLRPVLVRAVSRHQVLGARALALVGYAGLTLAVTAIVAGALALPLLGIDDDGDLPRVLLGYGAGWASDTALIGIGLAVSTWVPATAGTVVVTVLALLVDAMARAGLSGAAMFGAEGTEIIARFLPGSALAAWEGFATAWDPVSFAGLAAWTAAAFTAAIWRFRQMDVP